MNVKRVAVCGYRGKGKVLIGRLQEQNVEIAYIIERNYEALSYLERNLGIPVVGFCEDAEFYDRADVIILSGDLPENLVRECLDLAGIKKQVVSIEDI